MSTALLEARCLTVEFPVSRQHIGRRRPPDVIHALNGLDLRVDEGDSLAIVGESGCGKSTFARVVAGLLAPTSGELRYRGEPLEVRRRPAERRRIQMVFQDPGSSLNPRLTIGSMLSEILKVHRAVPPSRVLDRAAELLELVGLPSGTLGVTPRRLSGGQRQRVGVARALAVEPELLIADESVSALDVSVQAAVLNLLADLRTRLGLTVILIAHDLAVVRSTCQTTAVMYLGRIVEEAPTEDLFARAQHPYSKALLAVAPRLGGPGLGAAPPLAGEPPSPITVPPGCAFEPRCPVALGRCSTQAPETARRGAHSAACVLAWPAETSDPSVPST
jgi:oligopeptide/dipeptide ABC transporter ATP-binding protein